MEAPSEIPDRRLNAGLIADDMFPPPNRSAIELENGSERQVGSRSRGTERKTLLSTTNEDTADKLQ